ncbi:sperm tail-domain-containing protein [Blastocladiella britannica]|nr:sperm tail-domain-containing protein [Blastocladiella britannica]
MAPRTAGATSTTPGASTSSSSGADRRGPADSTLGSGSAGGGGSKKPDSREQRILTRRARIENSRSSHALTVAPAARTGSAGNHGSNGAASSSAAAPSGGALIGGGTRHGKAAIGVETPSKSAGQIKDSRDRITTVKRKGMDDVSASRIAAMQREQKRRAEELARADILALKTRKTGEGADALDQQIVDAWNKCIGTSTALGTPHELHKMLLDQKKLCEQLINAKENLMVEYNAELKRKDDDYVKELKRQADEIDQLLVRMDQQFVTFKKSLRDELVQIERAFMEERGETLEKNIKEVEAIFSSRKDSELRYLEERSKRVQDNADALEDLRVQDAEEYNLVKIKLETDVQVLEQQLQQMKATYQLNTEKLEYNYQVLKKRDDENTVTINQQKRRITRMTDIVNNLKAKLAKQDKHFASEHASLLEDYNRISSQYMELTKKFKHFQVNDEAKFHELWEMNQENIKNLAAKVLMADSVIHQQQLGLPWEPPAMLETLNKAAAAMDGTSSNTTTDALSSSPSANADHSADQPAGAAAAAAAAAGDQAHTSRADPAALASNDPNQLSIVLLTSQHPLVQSILAMLSTEATFLLDDKLSRLLAPLPASERALLKLDTILKALDVSSATDLGPFLEMFMKKKFHGSIPDLAAAIMAGDHHFEIIDDNAGENGASPVPGSLQQQQQRRRGTPPEEVLIHPNAVTKVLMRYLMERRNGASGTQQQQSNSPKAAAGSSRRPKSASAAGEDSRGAETGGGGEDAKSQLKHHWSQILGMLEGPRFKNWNTILQCMEAYHLLLSARHELTLEVTDLETQNAELKALLREYMSADVNRSLQVPPSQVILSQIQMQQQQQLARQQKAAALAAAADGGGFLSPAVGGNGGGGGMVSGADRSHQQHP